MTTLSDLANAGNDQTASDILDGIEALKTGAVSTDVHKGAMADVSARAKEGAATKGSKEGGGESESGHVQGGVGPQNTGPTNEVRANDLGDAAKQLQNLNTTTGGSGSEDNYSMNPMYFQNLNRYESGDPTNPFYAPVAPSGPGGDMVWNADIGKYVEIQPYDRKITGDVKYYRTDPNAPGGSGAGESPWGGLAEGGAVNDLIRAHGTEGGPEFRQLWNDHQDNLNRTGGRGIPNQDGSHSTLYAGTDPDGQGGVVLSPSAVAGGGRGGSDFLNDRDAFARAKVVGLDKYPHFKNDEEAMKAYKPVHDAMERDLPDSNRQPQFFNGNRPDQPNYQGGRYKDWERQQKAADEDEAAGYKRGMGEALRSTAAGLNIRADISKIGDPPSKNIEDRRGTPGYAEGGEVKPKKKSLLQQLADMNKAEDEQSAAPDAQGIPSNDGTAPAPQKPLANSMLPGDTPTSYSMNPQYYQDADINNSSKDPSAYDFNPYMGNPNSTTYGIDELGNIIGNDPVTHKPIINYDPNDPTKINPWLNVKTKEIEQPHYQIAGGGAIPVSNNFTASRYGLGRQSQAMTGSMTSPSQGIPSKIQATGGVTAPSMSGKMSAPTGGMTGGLMAPKSSVETGGVTGGLMAPKSAANTFTGGAMAPPSGSVPPKSAVGGGAIFEGGGWSSPSNFNSGGGVSRQMTFYAGGGVVRPKRPK